MKRLYRLRELILGAVFLVSLTTASLGGSLAYASTASPVWARQYDFGGSSRINYGSKVAIDSAGNTYVAGNVLNAVGYNHVGIVKYDSNGNVLWAREYSETNHQTTVNGGVAVDSSGNFYVESLTDGVSQHYNTLKYDSYGNLLWNAQYFNSPSPAARGASSAITVDSQNNTYVAGSDASGLLVIKYDSNGSQLWVQHYGDCGSGSYCGFGSLILSGGDLYVSGSVASTAHPNNYIVAAAKFDSDGNFIWGTAYDNGFSQTSTATAVDGFGNTYITGTTNSASGQQYLTLKFSASGSLLWSKTEGSSGTQYTTTAVQVDSAGNVYITGNKANSGWTAVTIKYDTNGNVLWTANYVFASTQAIGYVLSIGNDGDVYVGTQGVKAGPGGRTEYDYVILKYNAAGVRVMETVYHSGMSDQLLDMARDASNNIYVTGTACAYDGQSCNLLTVKFVESVTPPIDLTASSPTQQPLLTWGTVVDANSYNVYRNGILVDSSAANSYLDTSAADGTAAYYVTTISASGESAPSNTVSVVVDKTAPTITYTLSPAPNAVGWSNSDTTVTFACADGLSGVQTCSSPATISTEGANRTVVGTVTDKAGNTSTITATVKLDETAPAISSPTMSNTFFILFGGTANIGATTSDTLSGVVGGEYYIDTDPGQGSGAAMIYSAGTGKISSIATIPNNLTLGQHRLYMRSRDSAGNWSGLVSVNFTFI